MTTPAVDGRTWLERARELARMSPFEIHENPRRALDVIRAMLPVAEAAIAHIEDPGDGAGLLVAVENFERVERKDYR